MEFSGCWLWYKASFKSKLNGYLSNPSKLSEDELLKGNVRLGNHMTQQTVRCHHQITQVRMTLTNMAAKLDQLVINIHNGAPGFEKVYFFILVSISPPTWKLFRPGWGLSTWRGALYWYCYWCVLSLIVFIYDSYALLVQVRNIPVYTVTLSYGVLSV